MGDNTGLKSVRGETSVKKSLVVNEVLCFMNDRKDSIPLDNLVNITSEFYTWDELSNARNVLVTECNLDNRLPKRKGAGKEKSVVLDMARILLDPAIKIPTFVAVKVSRLPPVGIEDMDKGSLMNELSSIKLQLRELLLWKADLEERPFPSVKPSLAEIVKASSPATVPKAVEVGQENDMKIEVREEGHGKISSSQRNAKAKSSAVIGKRDGCRVSTVQRVKSADYFVSRIAKETPVEEIEEYVKDVLRARNVNISCRKLKTKFDTYSSFHVKVTGEEEVIREVRCLLDGEDGWPNGSFVRRYFDSSNAAAIVKTD